MNFIAIDFETADAQRDSAAGLGIAVVRNGRIVETRRFLFRPPRRSSKLAWVHGLSWRKLRDKPPFEEVWPTIRPYFVRADFVAAHGAWFDIGVLQASCARAGVRAPRRPAVDTVRLARRAWDLHPTDLRTVARFLGVHLRHHDPRSDALACAEIVLAADRRRVRQLLNAPVAARPRAREVA